MRLHVLMMKRVDAAGVKVRAAEAVRCGQRHAGVVVDSDLWWLQGRSRQGRCRWDIAGLVAMHAARW